jgi:hypothetical protein
MAPPLPDHRTRFLQLALDADALRFGAFTLKSGRESPYFFNAGRFDSGAALATLAGCYADAIDAAALEPSTCCSARPTRASRWRPHWPANTRAADATCRSPSTARKPRPTARAAASSVRRSTGGGCWWSTT